MFSTTRDLATALVLALVTALLAVHLARPAGEQASSALNLMSPLHAQAQQQADPGYMAYPVATKGQFYFFLFNPEEETFYIYDDEEYWGSLKVNALGEDMTETEAD